MDIFLKKFKHCMSSTIEVAALHILVVIYLAASHTLAIAVVIRCL